ncbi:four helix bundle protein [Desnuesiella massiliensis]|uniref:four helix bundle protein n=1 Tax=Desnuesiella massiliensis TaxID=1650662 RepID=UPI0006E2EE89|nr:four helix bundle protein [Desnuesiella massiliensis]
MYQDTLIHVKDFKTLKVWHKAIDLAKYIYSVTANFPAYETYAMKSQIIRCTTSIAANIAEGCGQLYPKKKVSFINNALGSASECRHWLELSLVNGYISQNDYELLDNKTIEIIKMLIGYMRKVQTQIDEN